VLSAVTTPSSAVVTAAVIASEATVPVEDASFLRAVLEAIPAFVVRLDAELRIQYINHLRAGITLEQTIGRPAREFVAPEDLEQFQAAVDRALLTGEPCRYMARGTHAVTRGGAAYYEGHAVPIDNGDGSRGVCIIATDVSEHMARADALAESEEKLRIAVEATGVGLFTWDAAADRLEYNQRFVDMVGCAPASSSEYMARVVHPEDRPRVSGARDSAATGSPIFVEHRVVRPDGEVRWMMPFGSVAKVGSGGARLTGGMLDVTARRLTEEHLRKAQRLDAVGSLTAGIAHNFNNMLAIILPALELSEKSAAPERMATMADAVHAARRAAELVAQLMTFAGRGRASSVTPHDLAPVVERAVSMCQRSFPNDIRIDMSIEPHAHLVDCDPMAIEQVVVNLLINARDAVLDAAGVQPSIAVELSEVDASPPDASAPGLVRHVRIMVRDNGIGMSDAVKQRLFEPFFTTKGAGRGTGLGLATSYGVVREHGGFITFESRGGSGTTAAVFLPFAATPVT